ncbi:MAG TPA: phosphoribosylglycinamide formyltransferase [Elusimicrobiota bacterium]|nr:phosphoribosylglycinamide formyltransferase [Elusimicrobiota bacterium]
MTIGIGVLVSGSGSNFEAIARAVQDGRIPEAEVRLVISNRPGVGALDRAKDLGVESLVLDPALFPDRKAYSMKIASEFRKKGVSLVCLAGFLLKVESGLIQQYPGRILNIHPSLLPKHAGRGMFGHRVHESVLGERETESGCTVHVVDEEYDHGPVLMQARVPVLPGDTPETLAARVLKEEHRIYPLVVGRLVEQIRKEGNTSGRSGRG